MDDSRAVFLCYNSCMKKPELLSPAGSMQAAQQAVLNGADAVYLGGSSFGARAFAANFTYEQMKQTIDFCHLYGARVFVTVNTLIYEHETQEFLAHLKTIYELGADAFIIQDIGMMDAASQLFPDIEIHASTQMHNHNDSSLCFVKSLGADRTVLAREMNIEQIRSLKCNIEKEAFIHGALCICYSGQCLFSALTLDRSGNRGKCAQSCRMKYTLTDSEGTKYETGYLLSPRDIALFDDVKLLSEAGIDCFKIEGRMKPPEYVGLVTKIYRGLLDGDGTQNSDIEDLKKLFNRGFTKGHLLQNDELMSTLRPNHAGVPLGKVVSVNKRTITIELSDKLNQGDGIKFERTDTGFICNRIYLKGKLVSRAEAGQTVELENKADAKPGDGVVKTTDAELIKTLSGQGSRSIGITAHLRAKKNEKLSLEFSDGKRSVKVYGDIVQQSKTAPSKDPESSIAKLGGTPFEITNIIVDRDDDIFIAKSSLNAVRREAVQALEAALTALPIRKTAAFVPKAPVVNEQTEPKIHALVRNEEQLLAVKDIINGDIYTTSQEIYEKYDKARLKISRLAKELPPLTDKRLLITDNGGLHEYHAGNDIVLDYTLNTLNFYTLAVFFSLGAKRIAVSPELDERSLKDMIDAYKKEHGARPALEALVYGRYELMAMQHCVIAHSLGEKKHCGVCKTGSFFLDDIKGNKYPIVTDSDCNNYILHSRTEQGDLSILFKTGVSDFRIEFLYETPQQCTQTAQQYMAELENL